MPRSLEMNILHTSLKRRLLQLFVLTERSILVCFECRRKKEYHLKLKNIKFENLYVSIFYHWSRQITSPPVRWMASGTRAFQILLFNWWNFRNMQNTTINSENMWHYRESRRERRKPAPASLREETVCSTQALFFQNP